MNDTDVAIAAAAEGAAVVSRCFGTVLRRFEKGEGDFATEADIGAEKAILALLHRERPDDAILAEESGVSGAESSKRVWLIDPLCGTLNYAVKMRIVAVNVALRIAGRFAAAAVADPFSYEIFWTDGNAAFVRVAGTDSPLAPNGSCNLVDLSCDPPGTSDTALNPVRLAVNSEFSARFRPRIVSSSLALTWVATGQRAAYVTNGDVRDSVHFGAGLAICEAAGCMLTDLRGNPWDSGSNGLIAAADSGIHSTILRLVRSCSSSSP